MQITITTPALLFPAISLLLLAYTSRFLALATLVRQLHSEYRQNHTAFLHGQISNLKKRLVIIRNMQAVGALSFFMCVLSMFLLLMDKILIGEIIFGGSLVFLMISLVMSFWEIQISIGALNIQLREIEEKEGSGNVWGVETFLV
jgi:hypothetical protein